MALPNAAMQLCAVEIIFGFCCANAELKDLLLMQVVAVQVSYSHDEVWFPAFTFNLGQILPPGAMPSKILL